MVYLVLLVAVGWGIVAGLACLSVCAALARFNHEAEGQYPSADLA